MKGTQLQKDLSVSVFSCLEAEASLSFQAVPKRLFSPAENNLWNSVPYTWSPYALECLVGPLVISVVLLSVQELTDTVTSKSTFLSTSRCIKLNPMHDLNVTRLQAQKALREASCKI